MRGRRRARGPNSFPSSGWRNCTECYLLVEWEPGHSPFDHARLKLDLEEMLGRRVDIGTERSLSAYIRQQALQEAAPL
jgi:hypothetical protein